MRWFKHMTHSYEDEKLSRVIDKFGLEGYGFYWRILEIIASQMDETGKTFCEYSPKNLGKLVGFTRTKLSNFLKSLEENRLIFVKVFPETIRIDCPNLLKYKDEYASRKPKNRESIGSLSGETREQDTDTDTDTDIEKENYSCAEPENELASEQKVLDEVVIELILNDKSLYPITKSVIEGLSELYPAVNVTQEFRNMRGWLDANPVKRKTKRGVKKFYTSWIDRKQNQGFVKSNPVTTPVVQSNPAYKILP